VEFYKSSFDVREKGHLVGNQKRSFFRFALTTSQLLKIALTSMSLPKEEIEDKGGREPGRCIIHHKKQTKASPLSDAGSDEEGNALFGRGKEEKLARKKGGSNPSNL